MYKVLLITDDSGGKKPLRSGLHEQGLQVTSIESSEVFVDDFVVQPVDVILVDLEKSNTEPQKLCAAIKRDPSCKQTPVVLLVTENQLERMDVTWGMDDYLTLPLSPGRLLQRVHFLLWKRNQVQLKNGLKVGDLMVDFQSYEVLIKGQPVDLTYKEFELLKFLMVNSGRVFTREALLDKVWGYDYYGGTRTVDVHIRRLRSKIEVGGASYIETIRNVGYKFLEGKGPIPKRTG